MSALKYQKIANKEINCYEREWELFLHNLLSHEVEHAFCFLCHHFYFCLIWLKLTTVSMSISHFLENSNCTIMQLRIIKEIPWHLSSITPDPNELLFNVKHSPVLPWDTLVIAATILHSDSLQLPSR